MKKIFTLCTAALLLSAAPVKAQEASVPAVSTQKVNELIEQFIKENPQMIIDSLQAHEIAQQKKAEDEAEQKLGEYQDYLNNGALPRVGNMDGDIHIVEFYDYNCGYCKRAYTDLALLLEADDKVKVTFVDMPILGDSSLETAKWSWAAYKQDKFFDYHAELMKFSGAKSSATLQTIATTVGLDLEKMKQDVNSEEALNAIEKNIQVARDIGVRGTPGFVINGKIYRGYLGYDGLKGVIDEIRSTNSDGAVVPEESAAASE